MIYMRIDGAWGWCILDRCGAEWMVVQQVRTRREARQIVKGL